MTIEQISRSTVKISLSGSELKSYNLNFGMLDGSSIETKTMLLSLLGRIQKKVDINLSSDKLYIEAFSSHDGGCLLYISVIDESDEFQVYESPKTNAFITITAELDNFNNLIALSRQLLKNSNNLIAGSQLFYKENRLRLILDVNSNAEEKISVIIQEYGRITGKGELPYAYTKEYFTCSEKHKAIEKISQLDFA